MCSLLVPAIVPPNGKALREWKEKKMSEVASKTRQVGMARAFAVAFAVMVAVALLMTAASASSAATAPAAPVISSPPEGSYDNDGAFTLSGTAPTNTTVKVFEGSVGQYYVGTVKADSNRNWALPLSGVKEGKHAYKAKVTDAMSNVSAWSNTRTVIVDTKATAPSITGPEGSSTMNEVYVNSRTIGLFGTAEPNSVVNLFDRNGNYKGTADADGSGNWSMDATVGQDGSYSFKAKATDQAGNVSTWSNTRYVRVDTQAPAPPSIIYYPTYVRENQEIDFEGTAEPTVWSPGTRVELFDGSDHKGTTDANPTSGIWIIEDAYLGEAGLHYFRARATDLAGNVSPWSDAATVEAYPDRCSSALADCSH
jgi:large repetitive protein